MNGKADSVVGVSASIPLMLCCMTALAAEFDPGPRSVTGEVAIAGPDQMRGATLPQSDTRSAEPADASTENTPSTPTGLAADDTNRETVVLTWDGPPSDENVSYRLYEHVRANRYQSIWVPRSSGIQSQSTTVDGLKPGSAHTFAITAVDAAGNESAMSDSVRVTTLRPPTAFHRVRNSREDIHAIVGEPFVYDVDTLGVPNPSFSLIEAPARMSIDAQTGIVKWLPQAEDEGRVKVRVRAANSQGSDEHTVSFPVYPAGTDRQPPSPVRPPVATNVTHEGATLSWRPATDNVGVAGYRILAQPSQRGRGLRVVGTATEKQYEFTVKSLKPDTWYRFWVQAYDAAGNRAIVSGIPGLVVKTRKSPLAAQ